MITFRRDGKAYFKANEVHIEIYTDYKNIEVEKKAEAILDEYGIFYNKLESFIELEKLMSFIYF